MPALRTPARLAIICFPLCLGGCSWLLPKGEAATEGPWQSFWEAQQTFDQIVPHQTTVEDLRKLKLDPGSNPNVTILNYSDVLRRFIPTPTITTSDLDPGVQECISAKMACKGYEIDQQVLKRTRSGNFVVDYLNFKRTVDVADWRFNGVVLIKDDLVVYKLTGGQPAIREREEANNPLGPLQSSGEATSLSH